MKKFILTSKDDELLSFVAGKLVKNEVEFSFERTEESFAIISTDEEALDWFADEFVCDCDALAEYEVTAI